MIIIKSKLTSFGLALVRRQACQVWCIYCFISYTPPEGVTSIVAHHQKTLQVVTHRHKRRPYVPLRHSKGDDDDNKMLQVVTHGQKTLQAASMYIVKKIHTLRYQMNTICR